MHCALLLAAMVFCSFQPARAAWMEAESAHFIVTADGDEAGIRGAAERLERLDAVLRYQRGMGEAGSGSNKVHVYIVPDVKTIWMLCSCRNLLGFYFQRAGGSIAFSPSKGDRDLRMEVSSQQLLFHEYTHHFMEQNFPNAAYPAWFVEGFAEFNSTAKLNPDGSVEIGAPDNARAAELGEIRDRTIGFILANAWNISGLSEESVYGGGWLITHYLMMTKSRAGQLDRYLADIGKGMSGIDAANDAFGSLRTLEDDIIAYLHKPLDGWVIAADKIRTGSIRVRRLRDAEAAMMPALLRSEAGVTPLESVAHEAQKVAAAFPHDADAQAIAATACYRAKDWACADASADAALAADPRNFHGLLTKGRVAIEKAARNRASTPADWAAARGWIIRANHIDPDNSAALLAFFETYRRAGVAPDAVAIAGLRQAFALGGEVRPLRWRVAAVDLDQGDRKAARETLAPIVFGTPQGGGQWIGTQVITRIDRGDDPKGIAKLIWDDIAKGDR